MKIGILSLQGGFQAHAKMIEKLHHTPVYIRKASDFEDISGLILPGGESSTNLKLLDTELLEKINSFYKNGFPIFGTCAGLILLSTEIVHSEQAHLSFLDIVVSRNSYGSQKNSCSENINIPVLGENAFHCIFIRAPKIEKIGSNVQCLATWQNLPIMVQQKNVLGASFHPELTQDTRVHEYFCQMCINKIETK